MDPGGSKCRILSSSLRCSARQCWVSYRFLREGLVSPANVLLLALTSPALWLGHLSKFLRVATPAIIALCGIALLLPLCSSTACPPIGGSLLIMPAAVADAGGVATITASSKALTVKSVFFPLTG